MLDKFHVSNASVYLGPKETFLSTLMLSDVAAHLFEAAYDLYSVTQETLKIILHQLGTVTQAYNPSTLGG